MLEIGESRRAFPSAVRPGRAFPRLARAKLLSRIGSCFKGSYVDSEKSSLTAVTRG